MKRLLNVLIVLAVIILIFVGGWFIFKRSVGNHLDSKLENLKQQWTLLYDESTRRNCFIAEMIHSDSTSSSELISSIEKNISLRNSFENECSIDFVKLEYDVNEAFLDNSPLNAGSFRNSDGQQLKDIEATLNRYVERYNAAVLDFNTYYSSFPNFIIAKNKGYVRQQYFEMKYGVRNNDPLVVDERRRHWIETGQWPE